MFPFSGRFSKISLLSCTASCRSRGTEEYREHCDVCMHKPMEPLEHATEKGAKSLDYAVGFTAAITYQCLAFDELQM